MENDMTKTAVVFGASGQVGSLLVSRLSEQPEYAAIKAVSRSGRIAKLADLPKVSVVKGDALERADTEKLCSGADVVFNCVGLPYSSKAWKSMWPPITANLLDAAGSAGAALIVADNLYCFGPEGNQRMPLKATDEEFTSFGIKPAVRAQIVREMLQAHRSGRCKVALVRASDFFGPTVTLSMLGDRFFPSVVAGKKVQLLKDPERVHDYTYLPDFVRALIAVSNDPESWGRAWHVPNAPAITTKQVIEKSRVLAGFDAVANYSVIPSFMRALLGCFIQPLREVGEMDFLFSADYTVEYGDFLERFPDCQPTPFETSLKATVEWYQNDYVGSDRG